MSATSMAEGGTTGGEPPGVGPPSKEERIDFLKQAIAFTEWNIRSFDTKAQIAIAAFVLSMNPIWSVLTATHAHAGSSLLVVALLVLFVTTVLLFGLVVWPVTLPQSNLMGTWESKGLFYVGDPTRLTTSLYTYRLKDLAVESELAAETLKLASIREIKARRFKHALMSAVVFYAGVVVIYLLLRSCGTGERTWVCGF
jgi:hypothetical protein